MTASFILFFSASDEIRNITHHDKTHDYNIKKEIMVWDKQLVMLNNQIDAYRKSQINNIKPIFFEIVSLFSKSLAEKLSLAYYQGWNSDNQFEKFLTGRFTDDIKSGYTAYGTHRSDIRFLLNHQPAKDVLSRGQKKIIVIALILAQFVYLIRNKVFFQPEYQHFVLLVDDLDSELDDKNLKLFFNFLNQYEEIQYFITTTNPTRFSIIDSEYCKMFHVEQ